MAEWSEWTDENGKWKSNGIVTLHVEPSQKWRDENPPAEEPVPEPSQTDILAQELINMKIDNMMLRNEVNQLKASKA